MSLLEQSLTYDYLFNMPHFIIDAKPMTKRLCRNHPKSYKISLQDYDKLLDEVLNSLNFSEHIMKKIFVDEFDCLSIRRH
jgi:hypothetical protein